MKPFMTNIGNDLFGWEKKVAFFDVNTPIVSLHANLIFVPSYIVLTLIIMCRKLPHANVQSELLL